MTAHAGDESGDEIIRSEGWPVDRPGSFYPGWLRCPRCGSRRIQSRNRPFLKNVTVCGILAGLFVLALMSNSGVLAVILFYAGGVALVALPTTVFVALAGKHRCCDCGHRFASAREVEPRQDEARLPWRSSVLSTVVAVLTIVGGYHVMRRWAGAGNLPDMMRELGNYILLVLVLSVSLAWHLALYYLLRRRLRNPLVWAVLFVLPGAAAFVYMLPWRMPAVGARGFLEAAQLAPLPSSARGIKDYRWSSPMSGEHYLRFAADPNEIEQFIADSPILQGVEPERFSADRVRTKQPEDYFDTWDYHEDGNVYYIPDPMIPSWYKQEIKGPARRYHIKPPGYHYGGEVIIDDVEHVVYVSACVS